MVTKTTLVLLAIAALSTAAPLNSGKLKFKVSGRKLPDKDAGPGTTDGFFELYLSNDGGKTRKQIGKSDTINNEENPNWGNTFEVDFNRNQDQWLYFKVLDHDTLSENEKVGRVWVSVADYVDKGQHFEANLDKQGYLIIKSVDNVQHPSSGTPLGTVALPTGTPTTQTLNFKVSATGLLTKDDVAIIPGKSDPYVIITMADGVSGKEKDVGRTATVTSTSNPQWGETFTIRWDHSKDQRLHFKLFDDDTLRSDDKLGSGWIPLNDYVARGQRYTLPLPKSGGFITINRN